MHDPHGKRYQSRRSSVSEDDVLSWEINVEPSKFGFVMIQFKATCKIELFTLIIPSNATVIANFGLNVG